MMRVCALSIGGSSRTERNLFILVRRVLKQRADSPLAVRRVVRVCLNLKFELITNKTHRKQASYFRFVFLFRIEQCGVATII